MRLSSRHLVLSIVLSGVLTCRAGSSAERPNVLLILVDDLKPALGCYGDPIAQTPHLDALAARGMRFDLAYCNQAVCAPSRFTLMLGSHSTSTGLYRLGSQLRDVLPDAVTLPQHFAEHGGYRTESLGKVFHIGHGNQGDPESFSVPHFHDKVIEYVDPESTDGGKLTREEAFFTNQKLGQIKSLPRGAAFESPDVEDLSYADGRVAAEAVKRLQAAKQRREDDGTPFFITVGFARPHLPFSAPKKYWDLYDADSLPMPEFEELPTGAPAVAGKRGGEITNYKPVPEQGEVDDALKRQLIHGYYASMSFVDAQIGKVVDALDRLQLAENTIVVLWGDHGFHLGDLGIWTKHTNYEQANRIPLLISAPGVTTANSSTKQPAESVDLYPTLAELAGLPAPNGPQAIDGKSLVPVLRDPAARVRDHAFHAYPKRKLGRAIRTERYRLVEWRGLNEPTRAAEYELYDYETDPLETENLAKSKPRVVRRLKQILAQYPEPFGSGGPRKAVSSPTGRVAAESKPNMLVYLSDDHSQFDSSLYGNDNIPTPQFEALAADGMTFTHAFVASPSCAPSRAAMLTGLMPARNGAEANHTKPNEGTHSLVQDLQAAGYEVAAFGKVAHGRLAREFGFDHVGKSRSIPDLRKEVRQYLSNRSSDRPLCLFVGTSNPHVAWTAPTTFDPVLVEFPPHHLDTPETRRHRAAYYQEIKDLDEFLGTVRKLAATHLGENTLVVHTSDHGSQWPFGKWNLYDYGIRVPFIASWPGVIAPGTTSNAMISWVDLLPTLVEVGGGEVPKNLDGRSFVDVLRGSRDAHRDAIFTTHTGDGVKNIFPIRSVRTREWKLIHNLHPEFAHTNHSDLDRKPLAGAYWTEWASLAKSDERARAVVDRYFRRPEWELFHVKTDQWEQTNLADDPAQARRLAELKALLAEWMKEQNDQELVHSEPRRLADPERWHPDHFQPPAESSPTPLRTK